jgi:hypothetical protein
VVLVPERRQCARLEAAEEVCIVHAARSSIAAMTS